MAYPLVILGGKGAGHTEDAALERPSDYARDGLGSRYRPLAIGAAGRPLIDLALEAYTTTKDALGRPAFGPIYIAGPVSRYAGHLGVRNGVQVTGIDTDGRLDENLKTVARNMLRSHGESICVVAAGDLKPDARDLVGFAQLLGSHPRADVVYPLVEASLAPSKRAYAAPDAPAPFVCGQVYGLRPSEIRWDILSAAAEIVYPVRANGFLHQLTFGEIATKAKDVLLQPRNYAVARSIPGLLLDYGRVKAGKLSLAKGEAMIERIALLPRAEGEGRRVVIEVTRFASLAEDIDRESEMAAAGLRLL